MRLRHIEEVLARKKQDARASASEEARKQAAWDEHKRVREEEEKAAASGVKPKSAQQKLQGPVNEAAESKWDRLMNGGGKKKRAKRHAVSAAAEAASSQGDDRRGGGGKKDSVSVRTASVPTVSPATRACQVARLRPNRTSPLLCAPGQRDQPDASHPWHGTAPIVDRSSATIIAVYLSSHDDTLAMYIEMSRYLFNLCIFH